MSDHSTFTAVLTIMIINPKQQISKVFQTTCINAIKEKSSLMFSENKKTLLCLSIGIPNVDVKVS